MLTGATVVKQLKALQRSTDGAVLTVTKTVGLTRQVHGLPAQVDGAMHGQWTQLNGMTSTAMDEEIIHVEPQPMCAQTKPVRP